MMPFKPQHFYFLTLVGYLIPGHDVSAAPHPPSTHKVTSHFPSNEYTSLSFSFPYLTDVMSLMMAAGSSPLSPYSVTLDTASTPTSSRDALTLMTSRAGPRSSSQIRSQHSEHLSQDVSYRPLILHRSRRKPVISCLKFSLSSLFPILVASNAIIPYPKIEYPFCLTLLPTCVQWLSHVQRFMTPWTVVLRAPLSMEFSSREY